MRKLLAGMAALFFGAGILPYGIAPAAAHPLLRAAAPVTMLCAASRNAATLHESINVDGRARSFLVHVPARSDNARLPILLAYHGRGETPDQLAAYSGLSALPMVVIYPRGYPGQRNKLSWSAAPTAAPGIDDVRFTNAILTRIAGNACVDQRRIFAAGKSDGGGMAALLACVDADRIAAVVSVAGAYYPTPGGCRPTRPVAIMEIHGTGDRVVPYRGSQRRQLPDVHAWLGAWAQRNGCAAAHRPHTIADGVQRQRWTACRANATVEGITIRGGGHTWPDAFGDSGPGYDSRAFDTRAAIAQFTAAHAR